MQWYLMAFRKYAQIAGRSRRAEYWMFTLVNTIVMIALMVVSGSFDDAPSLGGSLLHLAYVAATIIPGFTVTVRRLHDTGRSGWWFLIGFIPLVGAIVLLVFLAQDGQPGDNEFGANPKSAFA
jgi:uncharacterized membrane protein YhaH (DUF805 family)